MLKNSKKYIIATYFKKKKEKKWLDKNGYKRYYQYNYAI